VPSFSTSYPVIRTVELDRETFFVNGYYDGSIQYSVLFYFVIQYCYSFATEVHYNLLNKCIIINCCSSFYFEFPDRRRTKRSPIIGIIKLGATGAGLGAAVKAYHKYKIYHKKHFYRVHTTYYIHGGHHG